MLSFSADGIPLIVERHHLGPPAWGQVGGRGGGCKFEGVAVAGGFVLVPVASSWCRCLSLVSRRRSSSRTCGSPASGSRTGFTRRHARGFVVGALGGGRPS